MTGDPAVLFDAAFAARAPRHAIRPETGADRAFLAALFGAVSPLHALMPPALLAQQAEAADAHFRGAFPSAMRRILTLEDAPVGRIVIDWTQRDHSMGVDIAVSPGARGGGLALLRAWLATADMLALPCRLTVVRANPARAIYARLGFCEIEGDRGDPMVGMIRPPGPAQSRAAIQSHL